MPGGFKQFDIKSEDSSPTKFDGPSPIDFRTGRNKPNAPAADTPQYSDASGISPFAFDAHLLRQNTIDEEPRDI